MSHDDDLQHIADEAKMQWIYDRDVEESRAEIGKLIRWLSAEHGAHSNCEVCEYLNRRKAEG